VQWAVVGVQAVGLAVGKVPDIAGQASQLGLHARPAALFIRCVIRFKSTITIWRGEENFSAASLLEVLTANLDCGARVVLEAVGPDE
jgi:phosphotransferase system HPr (HPr) family protein